MYLIYSLLLGLGFLLLFPKCLLDAWRHGKYISGLGERLGNLETLDNGGRPVVWLHCVSVGEVQAARPLFEAIRREFPQHRTWLHFCIARVKVPDVERFFAREDAGIRRS